MADTAISASGLPARTAPPPAIARPDFGIGGIETEPVSHG
jgi:hypothetical protein